jgi:hypothetical protein
MFENSTVKCVEIVLRERKKEVGRIMERMNRMKIYCKCHNPNIAKNPKCHNKLIVHILV